MIEGDIEAMLDAYLHGRLAPAQAEEVELALLDHPELARRLQIDLMLKQGLAALRDGPDADAAAVIEVPQTRSLSWQLAAASFAAGALLMLALGQGPSNLTDPPAALAGQPTTTHLLSQVLMVTLSSSRSGNAIPVTETLIGPGLSQLVVEVPVPGPPGTRYRARILSERDHRVLAEGIFRATGDGFINLSINSQLLPQQGDIEVEVTPSTQAEDGVAVRYSMRLKHPS